MYLLIKDQESTKKQKTSLKHLGSLSQEQGFTKPEKGTSRMLKSQVILVKHQTSQASALSEV